MDGKDRNELVREALALCKLETNRSQPVLERCEGGLGGPENTQRQIRFAHGPLDEKDKIVLRPDHGRWSWEELTDLLGALRKVFWERFGKGQVDSGELVGFFKVEPKWEGKKEQG